ncbi:MAG: membrane protein insertase YidC [Rickettsiaceae bacterium]|nr:membrane protein insertase YidC [Rickettsiaceae bacterium]
MNYSILNLITAIVLSVAIIFGWQHFYEKPRLKKLTEQTRQHNKTIKAIKENSKQNSEDEVLGRDDAIAAVPRVNIKSKAVSGSISLKGLRFDDLTLLSYRQDLNKDSPPVNLFSPSNSDQGYFAEIGWWSTDKSIIYPDSSTIWQADKSELSAGQSVNLSWKSPENVLFKVTVSLDENYMFTIKQATYNKSGRPISTQYYGLINRDHEEKPDNVVNILHQGMIGAVAGQLQEFSYDKIKDSKKESFPKGELNWFGITDKYWLAAFIPDEAEHYSANYNYVLKAGRDKYQADFISSSKLIEPDGSYELTHHLFAGAKKVDLLDKYESQYNIKLFDRAIDFGWFYILTKPIFNAMNFFYKYVGNFGISIMIVTVIIKLLMFTLANKSYRSMKKMKKLQPQMERLKELYADDKARLNQEVMQLYKREKVNPVSGCLPLLVQIPVFFSIYKVLYVTIEMRHAPFFGWIKDLSAPDPTTIFNLFGLLPFTPPSFLMIGVWPLIMAGSMYLQQKMSPQPADPVQAQVMKFMPLMFLFMFSGFPAGLLIYWSWNNLLSIVQQSYINKLDKSDA